MCAEKNPTRQDVISLMGEKTLARTLKRWELIRPIPPPTSACYDNDPRIAEVQAMLEPLRGTLLEKMHWVNADEPEECVWGFIDCTGILGRGCVLAMPTWFRWPIQNDAEPQFTNYRKVIQLLLWKYPSPPGGHLILKCPQTAIHLKAFARVFPESKFVLIHRDPFRMLVSTCTLVESNIQALTTQPNRLKKDGSTRLEVLSDQTAVFEALMDFDRSHGSRVVNVLYADLMSDAVATTRDLYAQLGMDVPHDAGDRVRAYLRSQRQGKRLAPPKNYDSFGYNPSSIWSDDIVSAYCKHFSIPKEERRIVDTGTPT